MGNLDEWSRRRFAEFIGADLADVALKTEAAPFEVVRSDGLVISASPSREGAQRICDHVRSAVVDGYPFRFSVRATTRGA